MLATLKTEIRSRKGAILPKGSRVTIEPHKLSNGQICARIILGDIHIFCSYHGTAARIGKPVPSINTVSKWSDLGRAKSFAGATVEPDGTDSEGFPSWLLIMGLI